MPHTDPKLGVVGLVRVKSFRGTKRGCPGCGALLDGDTNIDIQRGDSLEAMLKKPVEGPKPGDWGLCAECGVVIVFMENSERRAATADELAEFMARPELVDLLASIQRLRRGC